MLIDVFFVFCNTYRMIIVQEILLIVLIRIDVGYTRIILRSSYSKYERVRITLF